MIGSVALRASASRWYWSCINTATHMLRAFRHDRADREPTVNPTINVTVTTTLQVHDGHVRRMSFVLPPRTLDDRVTPSELVELLQLAALARFRDHGSATRRLVRGMSPAARQRAIAAGILTSGDRPPPIRYRARLDELDVPALPPISAEALQVNRGALLQTTTDLPASLAHRSGLRAFECEGPTVWVRDPRTQAHWPYELPADWIDEVRGLLDGRITPRRVAADRLRVYRFAQILLDAEHATEEWPRHAVADWQRSFRAAGYAVIRALIAPAARAAIGAYARELVRGGYCAPGDPAVGNREWIQDERLLKSIHGQVSGLANAVVAEAIAPSLTFLHYYHDGAELKRHTDGRHCPWNISCAVDGEPGDYTWPLFMQPAGSATTICLQRGDAVLYAGTTIPHWREPLPAGHDAAICSFQFVRL